MPPPLISRREIHHCCTLLLSGRHCCVQLDCFLVTEINQGMDKPGGGDDYLSHHKGAVPLAGRRTFSFMKRDPVRDTTHRSSWAEPAAPGPRRDISSRCAKARGEAAPSQKSSADSSCASKVLHEGASRKTPPHHHITWKATLSQTASVKGHSSSTGAESMTGEKTTLTIIFTGKLLKINLVNRPGVHLLFCIKWLKGCCWSRYKLHSVNFRFGTPV